MKQNIANKKIKLFVDNGVDRYRKEEDITIQEMLITYLENNGFFVLADKNLKFLGYLDMADIKLIKEIIEDINGSKKKYNPSDKISELLKKKSIKLREETIEADTKVIDALKKLDKSEQNYFPIVEKGILLGRISKRILKEKIEDLY